MLVQCSAFVALCALVGLPLSAFRANPIVDGSLQKRVSSPTAFPLEASPNGRYLVDTKGKPFFYHADTPWMLLLALTPAEAEVYLEDRRAKGFTALQIQLTGFIDMKTRAGQSPFEGTYDFARPNEAYFTHADAIIQKASDMGFLLAIAPMWSGCCGEGWAGAKDGKPKPLDVNGPENARQWGRWVGARYAKFPNIVWIMGGDHDPEESLEVINALAQGIHEKAPHQLMTAHNAPDRSSAAFYNDKEWLGLNAAYSYRELHAPVHREWSRKDPVRPVFLIESGYEHEANDKRPGTPFRMRRQAYAAVLNGALGGHAYGHRDIWKFTDRWRAGLNDPGANQMAHVKELFATRAWWTLESDQSGELVTQGRGTIGQEGYVSAARAADGSLVIVYLPQARPISVQLTRLSAPVTAQWFDPTDGSMRAVEGSPLDNDAVHELRPPSRNAIGESDWVLLLEASTPGRARSPSGPR